MHVNLNQVVTLFRDMLEAIITVAWNGDGNLPTIFVSDVLRKIARAFINASILKLGEDIHIQQIPNSDLHLRLLSATTWVVILEANCAYTSKFSAGYRRNIGSTSADAGLIAQGVHNHLTKKPKEIGADY
ncbi:hypothetical protein R6Q59_005520 [Mikania micrantha]